MKLKTLLVICALTLTGAASLPLSGQEDKLWQVLSESQYKDMNNFERTQYGKALALLKKKQYRAASVEFERFLLQYKDSAVKPYIIFMQAYSLYQARDRNKAISTFNEVVDFYPDEINAAAPALYYRGMAAFANGDYVLGMKSMKEILDDEDYKEHAVAAPASLQLVWNYWRNKEPEQAAKYLKQIFDTYRKTSPKVAESARNYYVAYCFAANHVSDYKNWYENVYVEDKEKIGADRVNMNMTNLAYDVCWRNAQSSYNTQKDMLGKYRGGRKKGMTEPAAEVWKLLDGNQKAYEKCGAHWDWYMRTIPMVVRTNFITKEQLDIVISKACQYIGSVPDGKNAGQQQKRYTEMFNLLMQFGRVDQAEYINGFIKDKKTAMKNQLLVHERRGHWDKALAQCDAIMGALKSDPRMQKDMILEKANIHRDRLGKFDEAISLYRQADDPPGTLWAIAECHRRKNDIKAAISQYIEIENAFPGEGSKAAWARAQYQSQVGNSKQAIKEARYIMKRYPKSGESSQAHQLLERYGVDSGGGVVDDMD